MVPSSAERRPVLVIGAGPAGLTAAHELAERGIPAIVYEQDDQVGGLARTVTYEGYRFDIGGHRFFTKVEAVQRLWEEVLGEDFLVRPRLSRIYYRDRFFDYPLKPLNALAGLGPVEAVRILVSYARARVLPHPEEHTFEEWVVNRFGRRLFEIFFRTYTEKVWGVPCSEIGADWAAQRIKNLDLKTAVLHALASGRKDGAVVTTLIDRFHYPRFGPGMMWERMRDRLARRGVETVLETEVVRLRHSGGRVDAVTIRDHTGERELEVDGVISSMPLGRLVGALDPGPPPDVQAAADRLRHRDFLTVVLIVGREEVFPDNWIYVHSPDVRVGRVQNFKNWSPEMVPDPATTALGLEYFVHEGDDLWSAPDEKLLERGVREMERLGLVRGSDVRGGTVVRMPKAYPLYDPHYADSVATVRGHLERISNLHTIGRNGQHRYNNQDHSMVTGLLAARVVAGEEHDVWDVNVESEYHEEGKAAPSGGRATPEAARRPSLEELLGRAFARYDPVALGTAVGSVLAASLFLLTAVTLLRKGGAGVPLSLLGHYLYGYETTWTGALIGVAEGLALGFVWGYALAVLINHMVGWQETVLERELEALSLDPLEEN
ncbi:MAG TPA: NAD(P)/FAD-dependent oxidoreductase [Gemmatimonadota bacterium]|nr:NAD(P)/FAD-dependent oxidoreductase [Gemmatimonadota bacterium]